MDSLEKFVSSSNACGEFIDVKLKGYGKRYFNSDCDDCEWDPDDDCEDRDCWDDCDETEDCNE